MVRLLVDEWMGGGKGCQNKSTPTSQTCEFGSGYFNNIYVINIRINNIHVIIVLLYIFHVVRTNM